MKFTVSFFLIIILSFAANLYFPWWTIAIVAFLVALFIPQGPGKSFLTAFLALTVLWCSLATWISFRNEFLFAHKISVLILKMDNIILLITATGMIGGFIAGFAATSGSYLRRIFAKGRTEVVSA